MRQWVDGLTLGHFKLLFTLLLCKIPFKIIFIFLTFFYSFKKIKILFFINSLKRPKATPPTHCLTVLFLIYQNNNWTIKRWYDHTIVPSYCIILKIFKANHKVIPRNLIQNNVFGWFKYRGQRGSIPACGSWTNSLLPQSTPWGSLHLSLLRLLSSNRRPSSQSSGAATLSSQV